MSSVDLLALPDEMLVKLATVDICTWNKLWQAVPFFGKAWPLSWVQRVGFPISVTRVVYRDVTTLETESDWRYHNKSHFQTHGLLRIRLGRQIASEYCIPPDTSGNLTYAEFIVDGDNFDYENSYIETHPDDRPNASITYRYDIFGYLHCKRKPAIEGTTRRGVGVAFGEYLLQYFKHGVRLCG
jgi:hypothetical protein